MYTENSGGLNLRKKYASPRVKRVIAAAHHKGRMAGKTRKLSEKEAIDKKIRVNRSRNRNPVKIKYQELSANSSTYYTSNSYHPEDAMEEFAKKFKGSGVRIINVI